MSASEAAGLEEGRAQLLLVKDGSWAPQEENGATDCLSEHSDASAAAAETNRQQAPANKLKKTAFKFFGGKRSICTLPSFFGGKNKGQAKGASRKGLNKSKTHDGISDVGYEGSGARRLRSPSDGGTDLPPAPLPSSQSALLGTDGLGQPSSSLSGSSEGFEKKLSGEKSLFLPRSKKGLKGLFNSIRRHRKNKVAEPERTELQEWAPKEIVMEEQAHGNEPSRACGLQAGSIQGGAPSAECGENFAGGTGLGAAPSLNEAGVVDCEAYNGVGSVGKVGRGAASPEGSEEAQLSMDDAFCPEAACSDPPHPFEPEFPEKSPPRMSSGEQLNLMFGDVTSLKSFDSFTGCGDIIAEPDIDSITESSTSAERSGDIAKRRSCLVTYQGGGEEMAVPEELEEYLQQMWDGALKGDAAYEAHLAELPAVHAAKQKTHPDPEGTGNEVDLLTPHSDQQESAPNSDEGYYDSTTPGPEEDAVDGLDELRKDRLPRDSYSGDALYEFYEPDDVLLSPSHGDGSWFERKGSTLAIFDQFLDFALPDEKDLIQLMGQKSKEMEIEEERLVALQKQLLYWDMQREPALRHLDSLSRNDQQRQKLPTERMTRVDCLGCEQVSFCALSNSVIAGKKPAETPEWKDLHEMLLSEKHYNGGGAPKANSSCLAQPVGNGSGLDPSAERPGPDLCPLSSLAQEKSAACPLSRGHSYRDRCPGEQPERVQAGFGELGLEGEGELEQAINFSQALVEFTSSGTLFSSLSESLGSSDSGSAFAQNLPALPAMVTFDIVDVEQEGEGECEEQLEMNTEEDIATSLEAFGDSYDPKASLAECDERTFPVYPQISFQNGRWGVASLPRRLRLQELSPPLLEPLSVCRRSRSLDTEGLEFELASLKRAKNSFKPLAFRSRWSGCRQEPGSPGFDFGREGEPRPPEGREGAASGLSWPGLLNLPYGGDEFSWQGVQSGEALPLAWNASGHPDEPLPFASPVQSSIKEPDRKPPVDGTRPPTLPVTRPAARPSHLPLQAPVGPQEGCASGRPSGDPLAKKLAWVLPLGERSPDISFPLASPTSPDKQSTCKPVGVAEGMSQLHSKHC